MSKEGKQEQNKRTLKQIAIRLFENFLASLIPLLVQVFKVYLDYL